MLSSAAAGRPTLGRDSDHVPTLDPVERGRSTLPKSRINLPLPALALALASASHFCTFAQAEGRFALLHILPLPLPLDTPRSARSADPTHCIARDLRSSCPRAHVSSPQPPTFAPLHRPQADLHFCTSCPRPSIPLGRHAVPTLPTASLVPSGPLVCLPGQLANRSTGQLTLYSSCPRIHVSASHFCTFAQAAGRFALLHLLTPTPRYL